MAVAEDLLREVLKDKLDGSDIILERRDDVKVRQVPQPDGSVKEESEVVGTLTIRAPIKVVADLYRDILEDTTIDIPMKLAKCAGKIFKDATGKEYKTGYERYFAQWYREYEAKRSKA